MKIDWKLILIFVGIIFLTVSAIAFRLSINASSSNDILFIAPLWLGLFLTVIPLYLATGGRK